MCSVFSCLPPSSSTTIDMLHMFILGIGTIFSIVTLVVVMGFTRNSTSSQYSGRPSFALSRVSQGAKRLSEGFIGLITKAYHARSPEPDYSAVDFFSNPLKSHISDAVSLLRKPSTTEELITAIRALGHISITGGNETSGYIGKFIIPDLAAKLRNPKEPYQVKIATIEAISEMCAYCMKDNQDLCREYGILNCLIEGLQPHVNNKELLMRQWSAHALYYCLADHADNKRYTLNYNIWINLKNLSHYMHPDETMWEFNDAEMLLEMLRR